MSLAERRFLKDSTMAVFNSTCDIVDLRGCKVGTNFLDPCDCSKYYQCDNQYTMLSLQCSPGTLYVPGGIITCDTEKTVKVESCNSFSWSRCNVSESRLQQVESMCRNHTVDISTTTTTPSVDTSSGSPNAGMIVGFIIAGMVITLIIIAIVVVFRRRQRAIIARKNTNKNTAQNPEYFEGGIESDPYAIINDSFMSDPTYRGNAGSRTLDSISTTSTTLQSNVELPSAVYDNSKGAVRHLPVSPQGLYTESLTHKTETNPYDKLVSDNRLVTSDAHTGDINANMSDNPVNGTAGNTIK